MWGQQFVSDIQHKNGTATTNATTITFDHRLVTILIDNLEVSNKLGVSFDGGTTFKTVNGGANLGVDIFTTSLVIKALSNTVVYEILGGY